MAVARTYETTRARVEDYFDRTATATWERLTSDAPVSRVRATVRAGRDAMREAMLTRMGDLSGMRVLDAGCGPGVASQALAERGAEVVGVDISPSLIDIARERLPAHLSDRVHFEAGDMLSPRGQFDAVFAMDSLIYYDLPDLHRALATFANAAPLTVYTLAPRTTFLMAFWTLGKLFPRADRSPVMVPQDTDRVARLTGSAVVQTVQSGFYTSTCMERRDG
ncbi:MAG: magnesium protoporphyrin IX methyltransferase [Pseudomonadota bacterium]